MAHLGLVLSLEILFFEGNPCERRGVAAIAVEVSTGHFAGAASGTEGFVRQDDPPGQSHLLPVGKGKGPQNIPKSNDTSEAENTDG